MRHVAIMYSSRQCQRKTRGLCVDHPRQPLSHAGPEKDKGSPGGPTPSLVQAKGNQGSLSRSPAAASFSCRGLRKRDTAPGDQRRDPCSNKKAARAAHTKTCLSYAGLPPALPHRPQTVPLTEQHNQQGIACTGRTIQKNPAALPATRGCAATNQPPSRQQLAPAVPNCCVLAAVCWEATATAPLLPLANNNTNKPPRPTRVSHCYNLSASSCRSTSSLPLSSANS